MEKVLVTGLGLCTSLGESVETNWKRLTDPSPALRAPSPAGRGHFQTCLLPQGEGGRRPDEGFSRATELSFAACAEALNQADLRDEPLACTFSASKPLFDGRTWLTPGSINDFIAHQFHLSGERRNIVAACATGAYSLGLAASWIEQGLCEAVLAGSVEPYPHPLMEAGFEQMGVLSKESWMRPFDKNRTGFTFGEGAGAVVLESASHARRRGARALAVLSGWGLGADAHSAVAFNSNGQRIADVIEKALRRAPLAKDQIQHVNAHGTATRLNDWIETQALIKAFGSHADRLMISATKGSTGHLLGAAGSVEFIFTVLALQHQFIPPTCHLEKPDPQCPLDYTPQEGHAARFEHAVSLSFGFGGPIGALVVSAC